MKFRRALAVVAVAAVVASCGGGGGGDTGTGPGPGPGGGPSTSTAIDVRDNFFDPAATTVPVGTRVTWTWRGSLAHDIAFADGTSSPNQTTGTYSRLFNTTGAYNYICNVHGAAMSGRVVVQ